MTTRQMAFSDIATASLEQLTDELAAACWDSTMDNLYDARDSVARLFHVWGELMLHNEAGEVIRPATADEAAESAQTPEGWILVDGQKVYVSEG